MTLAGITASIVVLSELFMPPPISYLLAGIAYFLNPRVWTVVFLITQVETVYFVFSVSVPWLGPSVIPLFPLAVASAIGFVWYTVRGLSHRMREKASRYGVIMESV